jgi:putative hydrolase
VLTGIEVDILDDGSLDQDPDLLAALDVVVASVHSKLRMKGPAMTDRMIAAMANPHTDILGHCTGRLVLGGGRPESEFDADLVFAACAHFDKAVEVNCRPERLDPPMRLLEQVAELGCKVTIDTDAHAVGQLEWQPYGCARAADAGVEPDRIVNTWSVDRLLEWTATHG